MPEYIRPGTVSSTLAVTPAAIEVHNTVRWGKPDIRIDIKFASGSGRTLCRSLAWLKRRNAAHQRVEVPRPSTEVQKGNLDREATFPSETSGAHMPVLDLNKVAGAGFAALVLGGSTLVSPAVAVAADLPPYFEDQGAVLERPPVRSRLAVEETYIAPPVEHRIVGRRVIEQGFVGGYEGPALVPQQPLPIVPLEYSDGFEGPALVPPRNVPIVSGQPVLPPPVYQERVVGIPAPVEECRVVVRKRIDAYGDVTVRRTRICD